MAGQGDQQRSGLLSRRRLVGGSGLMAAGAALAPGAMARALAAPLDRSLDGLAGPLDGSLLRPGGPEFLPAALQTACRYAVSPTAIAVCASTEDAVRALQWARESGTEFAVRGGGHSYDG